jgi:hypothetical protein
MGLMVIKWIEYYYPLIAEKVPQKYGENGIRTIAFRKEYEEVIGLYPPGAPSENLIYDLRKGIADPVRSAKILKLCRKLKDTIVRQPMHYIGSAIQRGGEIYQYTGQRSRILDTLSLEWIIQNMGSFSIPIEFHHILQVVGAFVSGTNSIIFKWAEFTSGLSNDPAFKTSHIISLLNTEASERDVKQARNFYYNILYNESLECVWSGKKLQTDSINIDHAFPFVALRNNDLWNLLPAHHTINNKKRDAIPTGDILKQPMIKERIIQAWTNQAKQFDQQFFSEIRIALMGNKNIDNKNWQNPCYNGLIKMSDYLITQRGLTPWQLYMKFL